MAGAVFNLGRALIATSRMVALGTALILAPPAQAQPLDQEWTPEQAARLLHWAKAAPDDALPAPDTRELEAALASGNGVATDRAATALGLRLARLHLLGAASAAERAGWRIGDSDEAIPLDAQLAEARMNGTLDAFFAGLAPMHPDYAALRAAYALETDAARRRTLARNMERWRWMPRSLGDNYVLVNAAAFEVQLWRDGKRAGTWPVIVGKPSTPSPVFSATITGVTFNPWWDIPPSIVREKRGNFPARLGYVRSGGGWRQKPGPNNALGRMKLAMANPFNVYLHDTPNRNLFARPVRAFSHGCIRVSDALGFAAAVLHQARTRPQIDAIVARGQTATVTLPAPLPVHIAYFTAATRADGTVAISPDIYGRDARIVAQSGASTGCAA